MKKFFAILGIMAILGGSAAFVIGMSMIDWKFINLDTEQYTEMSYNLGENNPGAEEVNKIVVNQEYGNVRILRSGSDVTVTYHESERDKTTVTFQNGILTINEAYEDEFIKWRMFQGLKKSRLYTEISIPSEIVIDVEVTTHNSKISAAYAGSFKNLSLKTTNGKIEASGLTADSINLTSTNAKVELLGADCTTLNLQTTNAIIDVRDIDADNNTFTTTNGKINIDNLEGANLSAKTTNSRIDADNISVEGVSLITTNAKINVTRIYADSIKLQTTNAKVYARLPGAYSDYRVTVSTTNGKSNISNSSEGRKELSVKTSNANIEVEFYETY